MKRFLAFLLVLNGSVFIGQVSKLSLASDHWPPFTDEQGKTAFALDLVQEALARCKVHAKSDIRDFSTVMEEIKTGKLHGSAALWHNAEREKFLLYSEPYLENRLILVGRKGSDVGAKKLSELVGKRIAVVESYAYGPLLDSADNVQLKKGNSDQQNLERLLKGEVDYMLVDALVMEYVKKNQGEEASRYLEIGSNALLTLPLHFAIRKEIPGAGNLMDAFNREIKKMIAEGTYNRILQLNWVSTDIDGDGIPELLLSGEEAGTQAPQNAYSLMSASGSSPAKINRYVIEGNLYSNWESVPEKYKIPPKSAAEAGPQGIGSPFKF